MVDINLLKDTKNAEQPNKKVSQPLEPLLSDPNKVQPGDKEPKLPSRFSIWLKSLRGQKKDEAKEPEQEQKLKPIKAPPVPEFKTDKSPNPEDIFAKIDQPNTSPDVTPPIPEITDTPDLGPSSKQRDKKKTDTPRPPVFSSEPAKEPGGTEPKPPPPKDNKPPKPDKPTDRSFLVNLLPTDFKQSIDPKSKLISLGITILATAFVLGGVYSLLTIYRTSIIEDIQSLRIERSNVEDQLQNLKPKQREAIAVNSRLQIIKGLLNQHIYWTKFFDKLEKYTIDDVYYSGAFSGSLGGQITLSALGSSFTSPARQLLVLEQADDFVTDVSINSASASEVTDVNLPPGSVISRQVSFSISLTLIPDIYYYDSASFPRERYEPEGFNFNYPGSFGTNTNTSSNIDSNTSINSNTNSSGNINSNNNINSNLNTNTATNLNTNTSVNSNSNLSP